jgi:hypothetical protein
MIEFLWAVVGFIIRAISFVLDVWVFFSRMHRLARWATGSDAIVEVPPEPKILSPAAQRALDEAGVAARQTMPPTKRSGRDHAGRNPALSSAARASSDASARRNACTAGRFLRGVTSAKS